MQRDLTSIFRRFGDAQSEIACPPVRSLWFQVVISGACVRTSINTEFFSFPNFNVSVFLFAFFLSFFLFCFLSFFLSFVLCPSFYLLFTYFCGYFYIYLFYFSSDFYFFMFLNNSVFSYRSLE